MKCKFTALGLLTIGLLGTGCIGFEFTSASETAQAQTAPVLLVGIGVHIEPFGAQVSALAGGKAPVGVQPGRTDYGNPQFFERHVQDLYAISEVVRRHGGVLTVQAQTAFTTSATKFGNPILSNLEDQGHEIALHFHEDAHLGQNSGALSAQTWCAVMKEETEFIRQAGVEDSVRYWSGGNLYPDLLEAASCAGLDVNGDYKNPKTQQTDPLVIGLSPWRPADGPTEADMSAFARHDPDGPIIFLPQGEEDAQEFGAKREITAQGGNGAWLQILRQNLEYSAKNLQPDRANVFRFTIHPGEFSPEEIDAFLTSAVDPLVQQGLVRWATYSQMADEFIDWEQTHPGVDPRASVSQSTAPQTTSCDAPGYITFAVNVHDFKNLQDSANTVIALTDLFERYGARGDFYLTAPQVQLYQEQRPDVIERLKDSDMTISYHERPPYPMYGGFDQRLEGLSPQALEQTLRDYETYQIDLATGELNYDQPGGYTYVKEVFAVAPVVASVPSVRWRSVGEPIFETLGAQMAVHYHETGTKLEQPFEWSNGLLIRPSDFSITRWAAGGRTQDAFWWSMLDTPLAADYDPVARLQQELAAWDHNRPPFITALIHEENFYRSGATPFALVYYEDVQKTQPRQPPYDLDAPDPSRPRTPENQAQILAAYEALVAYAAANLAVVTSEDIVRRAEDAADCF